MDTPEFDRVMRAATLVAGGDAARAAHWYQGEPLKEFGGRTAADLVGEGKSEDVLRLLQLLEAGVLG